MLLNIVWNYLNRNSSLLLFMSEYVNTVKVSKRSIHREMQSPDLETLRTFVMSKTLPSPPSSHFPSTAHPHPSTRFLFFFKLENQKPPNKWFCLLAATTQENVHFSPDWPSPALPSFNSRQQSVTCVWLWPCVTHTIGRESGKRLGDTKDPAVARAPERSMRGGDAETTLRWFSGY